MGFELARADSDDPPSALEVRAAGFSLTRDGVVDLVTKILARRLPHSNGEGTTAIFFAMFSWLPLLVLVGVDRHVVRGGVQHAFAWDLATHVRSLIAIPVLVLAEGVLDRTMRSAASHFVEEGLVPAEQCAGLSRAMERAESVCHSRGVTMILAALSYFTTVTATRIIRGGVGGWLTSVHGGLSLAGWWYLTISVPLFQFLMLQSLLRWAAWSGVLWRASRSNLMLMGTHPDRAGGLGFLGNTLRGFSAVIVAMSVVASGTWTMQLATHSVKPADLFVPVLALVAGSLAISFVPMTFFGPGLRRAQLEFERRYSIVADEYSRLFDRTWGVPGRGRSNEDLVTLPAEPIANLGSVVDVVRRMRLLPAAREVFVQTVAAVLIPMAPLIFAASSPAAVLQRLVQVVL